MPALRDWNIVVTVHEGHYRDAVRMMRAFGEVAKSDYYNVLVMRVEDPVGLLEALEDVAAADPGLRGRLSRVVPVTAAFEFQDVDHFETAARTAAEGWLDQLAGKSFHVRMHRRGFRGRLSSQDEERLLDRHLLTRLRERGGDARITFDDPDLILAVESVGQRAGLSLWTRRQRTRYPLLGLD